MARLELLRLKLAIDRAIGEGTLIACVQYANQVQKTAEFEVAGSITESEDVLAKRVGGLVRRHYPDLNPLAVRLVSLRGSWQEAPRWTGNWYELENTQST